MFAQCLSFQGLFVWENRSPAPYNRLTDFLEATTGVTTRLFPRTHTIKLVQDLYSIVMQSGDTDRNGTCTLLLLTNYAEPKWIPINCNDKRLSNIICFGTNEVSTGSGGNEVSLQTESCSPYHVSAENACFLFEWHQGTKYNQTADKELKTSSVYWVTAEKELGESITSVFSSFLSLIKAVSFTFPSLLWRMKSNPDIFQRLRISKHLNIRRYQEDNASSDAARGFSIVERAKMHFSHINLFHCNSTEYLSHVAVCDGKTDCTDDNSDEGMCTCSENISAKLKYKCGEILVNNSHKHCGPLFYKTQNGQCVSFLLMKAAQMSEEKRQSTHIANKVRKSFADSQSVRQEQCEDNNQLLCGDSLSHCVYVYEICLFEIDSEGHLKPCPNGEHLVNCQTVPCNKNYKCPNAYCIPWKYVCDGKWDCAFGAEEVAEPLCVNRKQMCKQMFKCALGSVQCIPVANVCDDKEDCSTGNDEVLCDIKMDQCPRNCFCFLLAVECLGSSGLQNKHNLRYIFISILNNNTSDGQN